METIDLSKLIIFEFEWDRGNKDKNWLKHGVSIKECEDIFYNRPLFFLKDKKHSKKEKRLVAFGITDKRRQLTVVFVIRNKKIRIISTRDQSKRERRFYEQNKTNT
jgi:uncharacterized protein